MSAILTSSPYQKQLVNEKDRGARGRTGTRSKLNLADQKESELKVKKRALKTTVDLGGVCKPASDSKQKSIRPGGLKGKGKSVKKKIIGGHVADSDEEGWPCLVCGEPYAMSKCKEQWIRCNGCNKWSHLLCTAIVKEQLGYLCEACLTDSD